MQRTIGLIGGMSWESTAIYYKEINEIVRQRRGGLASADILLRSVDFGCIVTLQKAGDWRQAAVYLARIARQLVDAGASCILICTNTMHVIADIVAAELSVPLIHIVDVTAAALLAASFKRPLLLATRYTMEQPFYCDRLRQRFGISAVVPAEDERIRIHDVIFDELCCGVISDQSRQEFIDIIARARARGADALILGCTEIGLLIGPEHTELPVFDSARLHARAAADFAEGKLSAGAAP
ncbi:aspartate/glutamate racemase family protein [Bradyrhizobium sp. C-145]|uniref:aspartate/glutamate racemase family protein n=1 Tax=Bradyrhizobium sp. C-145 TaxID=574727 RepID=UPI00201B6A25|nr:aspartate/glutamate racemase family protein [Bradyrhizobium sp. C-145]UQR61389.1 aspartate/glutamate racemase family protein [Bradyrhizobium sp. C-145]